MKIRVFGPGCAKCEETERIVREAVKKYRPDASVEKVSDYKEMMGCGIMSTPAVSIDDKVVLAGRVPDQEEVRDWLTNSHGI